MSKVKIYRKRKKERKSKRGKREAKLYPPRKISQSAVSRLRVLLRKLRSYRLYILNAHELLSIGILRGLVINTAGRVKKYRERN